MRPTKLFAAIAILAITIPTLASCGSAPTGELFYIWPRNCPSHPITALNLYHAAGFTSKRVAEKVAATETVGIQVYWQQKVQKLQQEIQESGSKPPQPRATLVAVMATTVAEQQSYAHCTRFVRQGKQPQRPVY